MNRRIVTLSFLATAVMWFGGIGSTQAEDAKKQVHKAKVIAAILVGEAGGEKAPGMTAVLNVMQNRAKDRCSIDDVYAVATKRWQFTAYNRVSVTKKWTEDQLVRYYRKHPSFTKAYYLVYTMAYGKLDDVTQRSTHYCNLDKLRKAPSWAPYSHGGKNKKARFTIKIGGHSFFANVD
jgi:hypothetical protein